MIVGRSFRAASKTSCDNGEVGGKLSDAFAYTDLGLSFMSATARLKLNLTHSTCQAPKNSPSDVLIRKFRVL